MSSLPIISTLWIGKLSRMEKVCLSSFLCQGHKVELYVYDDVSGVPDGVDIKDANDVLHENRVFFYGSGAGEGKGSVAGFANHFRYKMLLESENTFWVDADVIALKPFLFNGKQLSFGFEDDLYINNAVIGSLNSGHLLFEELVKYCDFPLRIKKWDTWKVVLRKIQARMAAWKEYNDKIPWGLTGPKALTGYVNDLGLERFSAEPEKFYPVPYKNWEDIFLAYGAARSYDLERSYGLHLWNEQLRRSGVDKDTVFSSSSMYERLAKKYLS